MHASKIRTRQLILRNNVNLIPLDESLLSQKDLNYIIHLMTIRLSLQQSMKSFRTFTDTKDQTKMKNQANGSV